MAEWKRLALEQFPDLAREIERGGMVDLSAVLSAHLVQSLLAGGYASAQAIALYAAWAWREGSRNEPLMHLAMDTLAESIHREPLRLELWRALPVSIFHSLLPAFSGILRRDCSSEMEREYGHIIR